MKGKNLVCVCMHDFTEYFFVVTLYVLFFVFQGRGSVLSLWNCLNRCFPLEDFQLYIIISKLARRYTKLYLGYFIISPNNFIFSVQLQALMTKVMGNRMSSRSVESSDLFRMRWCFENCQANAKCSLITFKTLVIIN